MNILHVSLARWDIYHLASWGENRVIELQAFTRHNVKRAHTHTQQNV